MANVPEHVKYYTSDQHALVFYNVFKSTTSTSQKYVEIITIIIKFFITVF